MGALPKRRISTARSGKRSQDRAVTKHAVGYKSKRARRETARQTATKA